MCKGLRAIIANKVSCSYETVNYFFMMSSSIKYGMSEKYYCMVYMGIYLQKQIIHTLKVM